MKLKNKLQECKKNKTAILATNFYNFETLKGVVTAAKKSKKPLILQITDSSIQYMGLKNAILMGKSMLDTMEVEGWIHLDHGPSFELVEQCLKAGVDSVMIDGSELEFAKNVELTRKVVSLAQKYDVNVEAELGYVAKLGQSSEKMEYTKAEDARRFVEETGVNALAVAIGNAHGFYKSAPKLDIGRLAEINKVTNACLVLHGSSGIPDDQVKESVKNGICKINLATEIKNIFMQTLKDLMAKSDEIDLRKVFPPATESVVKLVQQKLGVF